MFLSAGPSLSQTGITYGILKISLKVLLLRHLLKSLIMLVANIENSFVGFLGISFDCEVFI